jgi:hypothetical protein
VKFWTTDFCLSALFEGFCKCQKSREDQRARTGLNKTDRPKAEDAPAAVVVIADLAPAVTVAATVVDAPAAATVVIAAIVVTAAAASMVPRKSISTSS